MAMGEGASESMMACAVWHGTCDVRLEKWPVPTLAEGEVLIRVAACGICGTDLHILSGAYTSHQPPRILGHEVAGTVAAVGPGVRHVQPGDSAAVDTNLFCGSCFYCREGRPFLCRHRRAVFGGFAEYLTLPEAQVYRLPPGVSMEVGTLAEPLSCCLHAIEMAELKPGGTAAVLGAGPMGLLLVQALGHLGITVRLVTELDERRRGLAWRMGATRVLNPCVDDVVHAAREVTDGLGVDAVFEVTGAPAVAELALDVVRPGGTVVLVGLPAEGMHIQLRPHQVILRELTIRGAWVRALEFPRAVALLPLLDVEPLLEHRVPLAQMHQALELAQRGGGGKVLVCP